MAEKPTYEELEKRIHKLERAELERKQAEEELQLTQFSVDNSTDAIYWIRPDAKFIYVNYAAVEALGYSKEELLTMTVYDIDPEFPVDIWPAMWAELKEKKSFVIQTIHQRKDESTFPVEITLNFIQFGSREINCAIARNISNRKQAEEALRESEERYRIFVDNAIDAFYLSDMDGRFIDANKAACNALGYTHEELLGMTISDVDVNFPPDKISEIIGSLTHNEPRLLESIHKKKDGKIFPVDVRIRSFGPKEQPLLLSFARDITDRKRTEEALWSSEEKLARSKKMESLGLLAGGVAHDLNNVLSGIVSYPELILMDLPEDSKLRNSIETIQESGHRAAAIVQDLLTVARGVAITKEPLNLNDLVADYLHSPEFNT